MGFIEVHLLLLITYISCNCHGYRKSTPHNEIYDDQITKLSSYFIEQQFLINIQDINTIMDNFDKYRFILNTPCHFYKKEGFIGAIDYLADYRQQF